MNHIDSSYYTIALDITFFVDEIKLEDGKRGDRVRSQIYQEIFRNFKNTYLNWHGIKEKEPAEDIGNVVDVGIN